MLIGKRSCFCLIIAIIKIPLIGQFELLNKIRNAITHQHIKGVNKNKKWIGVQLWNEPKAKMKDFEVVFTIVQLRNFAIKISKKYLDSLSEKNTQEA